MSISRDQTESHYERHRSCSATNRLCSDIGQLSRECGKMFDYIGSRNILDLSDNYIWQVTVIFRLHESYILVIIIVVVVDMAGREKYAVHFYFKVCYFFYIHFWKLDCNTNRFSSSSESNFFIDFARFFLIEMAEVCKDVLKWESSYVKFEAEKRPELLSKEQWKQKWEERKPLIRKSYPFYPPPIYHFLVFFK